MAKAVANITPDDVIMRGSDIKRKFKTGGGDFWAIRGISLEIKRAALTILKGRSGSGKTTLINILGALDYPTEGHIYLNGKDITGLGEAERCEIRRKEIGFVFQSVALVSMMTAYENVEFGLRVSGFTRDQRKKRVEECLDMVRLKNRMSYMAQELSGGEQQRVAIARAIAHTPKIIFADEPTAELDSKTGLAVVKIFKDLIEREGVTVVMTTHDPGLMEIADKLYELEDGAINGNG